MENSAHRGTLQEIKGSQSGAGFLLLTRACFFFPPDQDKLAYPAHHMVLETTSRNQGPQLSSSTTILLLTLACFYRPALKS